MIISNTGAGIDHITQTDEFRHKYGCAMAEYMDLRCDPDNWTGDVDFQGHFSLHGKRILSTDSRGFVYCHKFATRAEALEAFEIENDAYNDWQEADD